MCGDKARKGGESSANVITVKIDAIETPRGLVPSISSLENIVGALNNVLGEIYHVIEQIFVLIKENTKAIERISKKINSLDVRIDVIESILSEIKVMVSADVKEKERHGVEKRERKETKKELLKMIMSDEENG